jgi:tetratricopeptide (TPR) repeat protein
MGKRTLSLSLAFSWLLFPIVMTSEKAFADSADPNSDAAFRAKVDLARSYIIKNQEPEAQALIDELFAVSDGDKTKAEAARILAEDYLYIWKKRKANRLFRYSVENDPNNPKAREALEQVAYTYLAIEDYNAAEAVAKQLATKYRDHNDTPKFLHSTARSFRRWKRPQSDWTRQMTSSLSR